MSNPLVSIVIPVYNAEKTISRCLDSLVGQTYRNLEIICVDDCSKDNSINVIKEYIRLDCRVKLIINERNKKAGGARNSAIRVSKGEYLSFVDSDDWLALDAIERMLFDSGVDGWDVIAPTKWCDCNDKQSNILYDNLVLGGSKEDNVNWALINGYRNAGCLFRRSLIVDNNLYYPEDVYYEDNAVCEVWLYLAKEIHTVDCVAYYRQSPDTSITSSVTVRKVEDRRFTSNLFLSNSKRVGFYNDTYRNLIEYRYLFLTYNSIAQITKLGIDDARKLYHDIYMDIREYGISISMKKLPLYIKTALSFPYMFYYMIKSIRRIKMFLKF